MEISVRPLLAIVLVLALVGALAYLAVPRPAPLVRADPPGGDPDGGRASSRNTCRRPGHHLPGRELRLGLERLLRAAVPGFHGPAAGAQRIRSVKVVLVDYREELKLPFGIQYPDRNGPLALGNCADETLAGDFACRVAVKSGEPGPALDVAATVAAPYTLLDMFLARGPNPNEIRKTWGWSAFQPLLAPVSSEANTWQSSCLHLSHTP